MHSNIYSLQDVASNGRNPLSYYSQFGSSPQVFKLLLKAHQDGAKSKDASSKRNPLSYYCSNSSSSPEMVKVLLEAHPAALELKDVKDKVPIDYIKKTRLFEGIIGGRR